MVMRLTYPHLPRAGTIVSHDSGKWYVVFRESANSTLLGPFTVDIVEEDGLGAVADFALAPQNPRSVTEHHIVRRKWTVYGFAKVWGSTALEQPVLPPTLPSSPHKPRPLSAAKAHRKALTQVREAYTNRILGASKSWKQRNRARSIMDK